VSDEKLIPEYRIEMERKRPFVYIAFCVVSTVVSKLERIRDDMPNFTEWQTVTVRGEIRPTSRDK
jgi:hypothetical protein